MFKLNYSNICVLGTDQRMDYMAQKFYDIGYDVYRDIKNCTETSIVVLPPPVGDVAVREVLPFLVTGQSVYGGAVSKAFICECENRAIDVKDYLKWDNVTFKNAILTAKGIIKEAEGIKNINQNTKCLVVGYGFCGKAIASQLKALTNNISVLVRRKELKSDIEATGYGFLNMKDEYIDLGEFDFIFNTVPALVLDGHMLQSASSSNVILDIASSPGGTDFSYCKEKNILARLSLGIPGKVYPKEAGEIIADAIIYDLNSI